MKRRSDLGRAAVLAASVALMLAPAVAQAYCRTANCTTRKGAWQVCTPPEPDDCGTPLFWANRCVGFTLQKDASSQVSLKDAEAVFTQAFDTWMNADCGGGAHPSIEIDYMGTVECHEQEYNKAKGNANIIMFRDDAWPYEGTSNVLALTTVTYNLDTSQIYDADMEINSHDHVLTIGDSNVEFDLLSIATHESGHFLGLAHSHNVEATMFPNYMQTTTALRDLTDDDEQGICAAFPPGMPRSADCNNEPRHGFSSLCAAQQSETTDTPASGCSCTTAPSGPPAAPAALGLILLGALTSRRRWGRPKP